VNAESFFDRLGQLFRRFQTYPWWVVLLELTAIWALIYIVTRFLRGTRGAGVIKGVTLVLVISTLLIQLLGNDPVFERLNFLYRNFLGYASIALIIVFQPELRRALVRLGEARLFRGSGLRRARAVEEIVGAVSYLSKNRVGALIAVEREVGLGGIVEAGTRLDAVLSRGLIETIFWPGSALHDMGVVIRGDRVVAAGVQFPLAEGEEFGPGLGSRHRAAVGLSQETDALVIVVSEESGTISLAERGRLTRPLTIDDLRTLLVKGLGQVEMPPESPESESSDGRRAGRG
jgi:diadenylate cyclase